VSVEGGGADGGLFPELLLIFATALVTVALCRPARLPGTLGYFAAGALLGPTGLALIDADADIALLAEFGVVLLLFSLGLEFSLPRLLAMRRAVFGVGTTQVLVTGGLFAGVLAAAGIDGGLAVLIGGGLALSSTALVSRELAASGQLHEAHGRQAIGVLLFQDLAAVFLLILVPAVASGAGGEGLGTTVLLLVGKGVALFVALMLAGRWLLPPVFGEIARSRSSELFVLAALVVVMGTAWLTHALGLSMALGGFVGGMMLGESHYRHQVEADIRPFRDLLLGLFLVTVGMMLDLQLLLEYWPRVLAFGLLLMVVKGLLVTAIVRASGESTATAVRSGIVLAQGGEFAFALLALAAGEGLVAPDVQAFMVSVTLVSMVLTPALVRRSGALTALVTGRGRSAPPPATPAAAEARGAVVLLGFGRVGQVIGRLLDEAAVDWLALDADPDRVSDARLAGAPVRFGDATRADLLRDAGVADARLVVACLDDPGASQRALHAVRTLAPRVPVLVRTRGDEHLDSLLEAGATEVVPETFESSLMLLSHVMALLGRPREEVDSVLEGVRGDRYRLLHGIIGGHRSGREVVQPVVLPDGAAALGRSAATVELPDVHLRGVRRREEQLAPEAAGALEAGDIVVLVGEPAAVEAAETRLLVG
jgi:CPA2 family monovalent cation:H+ antiporter-2